MRTIEKTIYTFDELSDSAKEKAISNLSDINTDYDWWEGTYEDAKRIGLKITSFELDRQRNAEGEFLLSANEVAQNIFNEHGEMCETYKTAEAFMKKWQPIFDSYLDEYSENYECYASETALADLEDEFLKSLLEDYSMMLQSESEYLQSDESIIETILSNGYEFDENGNMV
jgi:hypothetical protein